LAEDINNLSVRDRVIYPVIYEELRHIYFPYDQSRQNWLYFIIFRLL